MADELLAGTSAGSSTATGALTVTSAGRIVARSLYLYESIAAGPGDGTPPAAADVPARALYLYVSEVKYGHPIGGEPLDEDDVLARTFYLYVSIVHDRDPSDVALRALYAYEAYTNGEIFPWIERIRPTEQYEGGQVEIYGDGFGATQGTEGSAIRLGVYDPDVEGPGMLMGVVSWSTRSANLHPANGDGSGAPPPLTLPAIVATVPADAESGMLSVEETI
jgi:hypothetical protein